MNYSVHVQATHRMAYVLRFGEYRCLYRDAVNSGLYNGLSAFTLTI